MISCMLEVRGSKAPTSLLGSCCRAGGHARTPDVVEAVCLFMVGGRLHVCVCSIDVAIKQAISTCLST